MKRKSTTGEPQRAPVGLAYRIRFDGSGKQLNPAPATVYTVAPKCSSNFGRWHCATHEASFENNLQKDLHLASIRERRNHSGVCLLAWLCFEHGAEVP